MQQVIMTGSGAANGDHREKTETGTGGKGEVYQSSSGRVVIIINKAEVPGGF